MHIFSKKMVALNFLRVKRVTFVWLLNNSICKINVR